MEFKSLLLSALFLLSISLQAQTVQRNSLIEDFSNEECSPCKSTSESLHPAIASMAVNETASHLNMISYQLDYPGMDASYNLHAEQRADYYTLTGIPAVKVNGKAVNQMFDEQSFHETFDTSRNTPSSITITGSYIINTAAHELNLSFSVTALTPLQGPYKVYAAVVERHYTNPGSSIGMFDYYFVMRKMFPDGNGKVESSWAANTAKQFQYTTAYAVNNPPLSGSFDFWGNPMFSDLVVFVQDTITRQILQSQVIKPSTPTRIAEQDYNISNTMLYPNPAKEHVSIAFDIKQKENIIVSVTDVSGKMVQLLPAKELFAGRHEINIITSRLTNGTYVLQLVSGNEKVVKLFNILR